MDTHDVTRDRDPDALSRCPPGALVVAISSDGLFTLSELRDIAEGMPEARLEVIDSPEDTSLLALRFADKMHDMTGSWLSSNGSTSS